MKKKKFVTAILSLVIVFSVLTTSIYAYRGIAYLFLYDSYLDYAETCVFDLIMYGFDTGSYVHNSADDVYSVMPTSSILVHFGEGGPGYIFCEDDNWATSAICGDTNCSEYLYPTIDRALSNMPYVTNKTNLLTMYLSGNAGITPDPIEDSSQLTGYVYPANLVTQTASRYSKCAVGWLSVLPSESKMTWFTYFTSYCEDYPISESIERANFDIGYYHSQSWGDLYDQYIIRGNGSLLIS